MNRKQAWDYYSCNQRKIPDYIFNDLFQSVYNKIDEDPDAKLAEFADSILKQLVRH